MELVGGSAGGYGERGRNAAIRSAIGRFAVRQRLGAVGAGVIAIVVGIAVLAPWIAPYGKDEIISEPNEKYDPESFEIDALSERNIALLNGPSWKHPLGTDALGRDTMSRIMYGARLALLVGVVSAALAVSAGSIIAIISGYMGGWVDLVVQRIVDAMIAIPGLLILLLLVQVAERSVSLTVMALAVLGTFQAQRVVRSASLPLRNAMFVEAARSVGAGNVRIMIRHIAPNVMGTVIVIFSVSIGANILAEAGLAFLNLSVPGPSWGSMVSEGRAYVDHSPMLSVAGGGAITLTVLAFNLLGDALRDVLDPRQRRA